MKIFLTVALLVASISAIAQPVKNAFDEDPGKVKAVPVLTLDEAWQKLPTYKFGDSLAPLKTIDKAVAATPKTPGERNALAAKLGAVLENKNSTKDAKKFACRQLAIVGDTSQVPTLNALLLSGDEDLAFFARYALERIPDAAASQVLREALTKTKGATLAGVIDSLGVRRDATSVHMIFKAMQDADDTVVRSGLKALGNIGGAASLEVLGQMGFADNSPLLPVAQAATLRVADDLLQDNPTQSAPVYRAILAAKPTGAVHVAAWRGVVKTSGEGAAPLVIEALKSNDRLMQSAAAGVIPELPKGAFTSVANAVSTLPNASQVLALNAMSNFGVPVVREAALTALKSNDENVRVAALGVLAQSGDASTIGVLAKAAAESSLREKPVAQNALERLRGETTDAALIAQLEKASPNERAVLARALGVRHAPNATPVLLKAAGDVEANVRLAALEALAQTAQPNDVPALLDLQAKALNAEKRELSALEKTMVAAVLNGSDKEAALNSVLIVAKDAAPQRKASLLRVVGGVSGAKANTALIEAAKETDETIRDAAVRALSISTDQSAAPALLELAQKGQNVTHKALALNGYVRLADDKTLKNSDRLKMYEAALRVAPENEKKRVFSGLSGIAHIDALKLVAPFLENEALREEAAVAVNVISTKMLSGKVGDKDQELLRGALKKLIELSKNEAQRKQATENLKKLG
ncbi:MAG TPA: HEAT repeat domain-containing protein [Abditibacteriaceae bacterium]